ncbi:MAG: ABC transporter ATP-binding protein [Thermoproteota archaeon]|nr:ABC transporter ATP-binding protein [Thermoproteota archaeon]
MLSISASGVTKLYRGTKQPALKDISLKVEEGKIFTLLGKNGAGKTTFVRICATQLMPTSGEIRVLGYDVVRQAKSVRELISVVPQEGRPLRALTPWDHVYNWLQIRGDRKEIAKDKTENILRKLGIYEARDRPAMNLSGGMRQKILVAMAMASDARLLFLDEPTIGLDPVSRRQVWSTIKDWKRKAGSILLTTHYMDEAEILSDYIIIMDKGMMVAQGTIQELRRLIPQNVRIDIARDTLDIDSLKSYGSVVDTGAGSFRVFTFESAVRELSELALRKKVSFTVSSITLDDVFVYLMDNGIGDDKDEWD